MKKLLLSLLCLTTVSAHASHVYEGIDKVCTYQDLTAPNTRPKQSVCRVFVWESMHVYDKQRGGYGYVAGNGEEYRLPGGKTVTFSYEVFMKSEGSGPEIGKYACRLLFEAGRFSGCLKSSLYLYSARCGYEKCFPPP